MRLKSCVAFLVVLFALSPFCTFAAEITVTPSLGLRGEYDDNILFDSGRCGRLGWTDGDADGGGWSNST